jgi:hypothetical protein
MPGEERLEQESDRSSHSMQGWPRAEVIWPKQYEGAQIVLVMRTGGTAGACLQYRTDHSSMADQAEGQPHRLQGGASV